MAKRVACAGFKLELQIGGNKYPVGQAYGNFAINRIPSAMAALAVGRSSRTLQDALVHSTASTFKYLVPAQLLFTPVGDWTPNGTANWNDAGSQVIFDGYATGVGYRKLRGTTQFCVKLIHWLVDLTFSSALTSDAHPNNAGMLSFQAVYEQLFNQAGAGNEQAVFLRNNADSAIFLQDSIQEDLWANSLSPLLASVCTSVAFAAGPLSLCGLAGGVGDNKAGLATLKRIEGGKQGAPKSKWYAPLSLKLDDATSVVTDNIGHWLSTRLRDSFWDTTLWDKLIGEWAPNLGFSLVPKVQTAQVVPFIAGLRSPWQKQISVNDLNYWDFDSLTPRPLRAVQVVASAQSATGAANSSAGDPSSVVIAGCFPENAQNNPGMLLLVPAPGWLDSVISLSPDVINSIQVRSSTTPGARFARGDKNGNMPNQVATSLQGIYSRYAQAYYNMEMLRGRSASVLGKLRFDIAPGSTIEVDNPGEPFVAEDNLSTRMFGDVVRVSFNLDAQAPSAGTSFQLANCRTADENQNPLMSIDAHPMYNGATFPGAPLIDAYLFQGN